MLAGLQARGNLRVGQGDLATSVTLGVVRHAHQQDIVFPGSTQTGKLTFEPLTDLYHQVVLEYTYWATSDLGLTGGVSLLTMNHGNRAERDAGYVLASAENLAADQLTLILDRPTRMALAPRAVVYLFLGVVWRPF